MNDPELLLPREHYVGEYGQEKKTQQKDLMFLNALNAAILEAQEKLSKERIDDSKER